MSAGPRTMPWPASHDFVEAIQNPQVSLRSPQLRGLDPILDRLGMPLVASGNFAYAFKLQNPNNSEATGVKCFRGYIPDRDKRYAVISRHLAAHPVPCLTDFRFDQEGILVAGHRYPIVVMEWIEGPTLDLYVEQILHEKASLLHLADEWLGMLHALRSAQVAHGDLQHGNIIVRNSQIRLLDLDGMFVPAMQGWPSIELGHPHFQHPRRDLTQFNVNLDNFSALVIYLTFLALAEAPDLWQEYHDENLIFCRSDFVNPGTSQLFARLRQLGPEIAKLGETLEKAAMGRPQDAPWLLNLASRKSKLPVWMTTPSTTVKIEVRTRAAPPGTLQSPLQSRYLAPDTFRGAAPSRGSWPAMQGLRSLIEWRPIRWLVLGIIVVAMFARMQTHSVAPNPIPSATPNTNIQIEERLLRQLPAQRQAETLLERCIRHDLPAQQLFDDLKGEWTGQIWGTDTLRNLENRARYSSDLRVRYMEADVALAAAGFKQDKSSVERLEPRLSEEPEFRSQTLLLLGMLAGRGIEPIRIHDLLVHAANTDLDEKVRQAAVEGLRFLKTDEALEDEFYYFTHDPSFAVRDRAGCNVADCGIFTRAQRMQILPKVLALAEDPSNAGQMHQWTLMTLQAITDQNFSNAADWRQWYNQHAAEKERNFATQPWWRVKGDE